MARIRTIKPSFWSDPDVARLSRDARLLAVGLISFADDEGRFPANPSALLGYVYPHDRVTTQQVRKWRDEIANIGMIELYQANGIEYGWFPNWHSHQKINRRYPSSFPSPPSVNGTRHA